MGSLVKYHLAEVMNLSPEQIYHVTVMPCYDKKLEASREDFYNQQRKTRDVDCVITSSIFIHISALNLKLLKFKYKLYQLLVFQLNWNRC